MNDVRCNRCGRRCLHMVELAQNGLGFPRFYCNSPEWGFDCWDRVAELRRLILGDE